MKKVVALLLVLVMCASLCACGKSEAAVACEELIAQIGTVSLDSEAAIVQAENALAALTEKEQELVAESAQVLAASRSEFEALKEEAERQARLDEASAAIDGIGEVSLDSAEVIAAAEAAYAALSDEEKGMIPEATAKLEAALETYENMVAEENAAKVIAGIDAIGTVTLESGDAINAASELFGALTEKEKALVTNADILTAAQTELEDLKAAEKAKVLKQAASKFKIDEDKVDKLAWYMPKNMPKYIDTRSYIIPYVGVKNGTPWVCIRYNYTADDWVFWESLKIVVDGETFYKFVGPFGTVRDNEWGNVWEYYDEALNYNQSLDSEQLVMLKKIAESTETIIRFQGDDYHYDLVVKQKDKDMIKDVLALYEALLDQ